MHPEPTPQEFLNERDNILIAPAGFGKTYFIADCVSQATNRQLILTHTQAGVASIKEKLRNKGVSNIKYRVETISSFAQSYVRAFDNTGMIPEEQKSSEYYPYIINKCIEILKMKPVQDVVCYSYSGLFVDEYQDCSETHHLLVLELANLIPTHILGDPMQGIFNFNGKLVDLEDETVMGRFSKRYELKTPHRWINSGKLQLGDEILMIRNAIKSNVDIALDQFANIEYLKGTYLTNYRQILSVLLTTPSVLVIHPISNPIAPREKVVAAFKNIPELIEAIDARPFYEYAKLFDNEGNRPAIDIIDEFIVELFAKIGKWYNKVEKKFIEKRSETDRKLLSPIKNLMNELSSKYDLKKVTDILVAISKLPLVKCYRRDLLRSILASITEAYQSGITVTEAMKKNRDMIRRVGKRIVGKCVGTTLLTKGLEFDTVIVLDADTFDSKNLYVAISRCTKRLMVLSQTSKISPYTRTVR